MVGGSKDYLSTADYDNSKSNSQITTLPSGETFEVKKKYEHLAQSLV